MCNKNHSINIELIKQYCEDSGAIPPLFLGMEAENIANILNGGNIDITHEELMKRLFREKRYPNYHEINKGLYMKFQSSVGLHQIRMEEMMKIIFFDYPFSKEDLKQLFFAARYHDSPEGISVVGDIPTPIKENFSGEVGEIHRLYETRLIDIVGKIIDPSETGFSEEEATALLHRLDGKSDIIGQINSYIDKLEACMDSIHEIRNDNTDFFLHKKLPWYMKFFTEVLTGERLPLVFQACTAGKLPRIFNGGYLAQKLQEIHSCTDSKERNMLIDNLDAYKLWKQATRNIGPTPVGNTILKGEELLTIERS